MDLIHYFAIIKRQWQLVVALPLLVALISLAVALMQPPRYQATARLLVMLDNPGSVDTEDALAYDLPAIVNGQRFTEDVAAALTSQGFAMSSQAVAQALSASNQKRQVWLSASTTDPELAQAIAATAVELLQAAGLRYWGSAAPVPDRPGVIVEVLDPPAHVITLNGPRAIAIEVGLRAIVGFCVGIGIAFGMHYLRAIPGRA